MRGDGKREIDDTRHDGAAGLARTHLRRGCAASCGALRNWTLTLCRFRPVRCKATPRRADSHGCDRRVAACPVLFVPSGGRGDCTDHSGLRFRARRADRISRGRQAAAGARYRLRRRRRLLSLQRPRRDRAGRPRRRAHGRADRGAPAGPRSSSPATPPRPWRCRSCARASRCRSSALCRRSSRLAPARSPSASRCLAPRRRCSREYTRALIRDFAKGSQVTLVGSEGSPATPRRSLTARRSSDAAIVAEIAPCFLDGRARAPTRSCSPAPIIRC